MRALEAQLDRWDQTEGGPAAALALLSAAEAAGPRVSPALWHRFLDTTRRPRFLQSLPGRADRHRWADAAFAAIRASRYTLATMLAQRVREHPGRTLFQESPLPGAPLWSYEAIARRLERTAAAFLRAQRGQPRVAILSSNGLDAACADLACLVHGIPVTPLNPETDPETLGFILDRLRVNVVVAETDELRARARARPRGPAALLLRARPRGSAARHRAGAAGRGAGGPRPGPGAAGARGPPCAVPRRARDRHVHVRQHRPSEGRRAHRPRARHEALRARGGAAGGGRGRGAAVLPAALPHVRPLPRDDGDAVLGRDVRLRRQPVLRHAGTRPALGAAHRPRRHPAPLGAAARAVPGARARGTRRCARSPGTACAGGSPPPGTSTRRCSATSSGTGSSCAAGSG